MKINEMWAMFDRDDILYYPIKWTRKEVINAVEKQYGMKWRYLYKRDGFRIKKVIVSPLEKRRREA